MAVKGTKKFWKQSEGASQIQKDNQILKNAGYFSLQLRTVNYMSSGNFWQRNFGGSDTIALSTTLKYESGVESIEATTIQDVRKVKANRNHNLALQSNIAVKIPANSDAISFDVKLTAVTNDELQAKFEMLNKPEYRSALQLVPTVVGQVLTVTSLVKDLFTDSKPKAIIDASYAGIISAQSEEYPVKNGRLTQGFLIMISTDDGNEFNNVDESKFELRGDALYYDNQEVENTYVIFNISFESVKGENEKSNWYRKYSESLNNLDKIHLVIESSEIQKIYSDSKNLWIEGNALLDVKPALSLPTSNNLCDCSGFVCWVLGLSRQSDIPFYKKHGGWIYTDSMVADINNSSGIFEKIGIPEVGCIVVYGAGSQIGHVGLVSEVINGKMTKVIHCSSGNDKKFSDSIQETPPTVFNRADALWGRFSETF